MPAAPPPAHPTDVLVVGAGLAGLPVALELARRGASVRVVDRGAPGAGTSRVAAGMLAPVTEVEPDDPDHLAVGRAGLERWPGFAATLTAETGIALPLHRAGTLALARDRDEAEALDRFAAVCGRLGLPVERLLPSAARRLEPALAPTLRGALSVPGDLAVDPRAVVAALVEALRLRGVVVERGTVARVLVAGAPAVPPGPGARAGAATPAAGGVARPAPDGDATESRPRATGVVLDDGTTLAAGAVLIASGAHPIEGIPAGSRVPVRPVKGQLLVLRDPSGPGLVRRVLRFGSGYVVPRGDGRYVLGATTEERGFDVSTTAWALHDLLRDGAELVPALLDLRVEETLAGLRPTTPDALPALGPAAGVDGLWLATGHHRNGVLLAPLTGELVAGAIAGDHRDPDVAAVAGLVAPARFAGDADDVEAPATPDRPVAAGSPPSPGAPAGTPSRAGATTPSGRSSRAGAPRRPPSSAPTVPPEEPARA